VTSPSHYPLQVLPRLWLFAPSRDRQGGSSWWLENEHLDLLIDCPDLTEANLHFLAERARRRPGGGEGSAAWIVLTGRDGHGRCRRLQQALGWPVLVQEQEAYLLPGVDPLVVFAEEHRLGERVRLLWTPGPSPGACVLHVAGSVSGGRDGLFCGRLLLPVAPGHLAPLRSRRCFHWPRQLRSLAKLRTWLPEGSSDWIATGAPLGALRGEKLVREGSRLLASLDLESLEGVPPGPAVVISGPPPAS
jgi:glyoxylase-like metal-dependent hydrolase (beta-lactamase superfamily II)